MPLSFLAAIMIKAYGVIPVQEGKILVVRHVNGGHWGFPKGRPEEGETPQETAKRELFEETGLQVVQFLSEEPLLEQRTGKTVYFFPALVSGVCSFQSAEIMAGRWVNPGDLIDLITFEDAKRTAAAFICSDFHGLGESGGSARF